MIRVTLINLWPEGGMLHYATALGNALARRPELAVTALLPRHADRGGLDPRIEVQPVDLELRRGMRHALANVQALGRIDRFLRAVRASRPDVLHLNSSHPWLIPTAGWLARRWPLVATVHDVDPHPGEDGPRRRLQGGVVLRRATAIAVHGEALRASVLRRCPWRQPADVVITPHGTYGQFGEALPASTGPGRPTVLFFGRIVSYKGLEVLLRAAPLVREQVPDVRFVVAGEGNLEPYTALLGDDSLVELHAGYVPDDAVAPLFRDATVLAVPYTEASWSGVVSIAHSFGLPVVASAVGCLPDAVQDGVSGLLVPPGDSGSLADALVLVLRDTHLRESLRRGALGTPRAGWDEAAETLSNIYRNAIISRK